MKDGIYKSYCGLCHMSCGIEAKVCNNKIVSISGDCDHPGTKGRICQKALCIPELVASPDRLRKPLIRLAKGSPLKAVSWNDALDFAGEKLLQLKTSYGSQSLIHCNGAPVNHDCRDGFKQFMAAFGSELTTGASNCCMVPRVSAYRDVMGIKPEPDLERANILVFWGANPENSMRIGNFCAYGMTDSIISRAKKRGAKIVVVDPIYSEAAQCADEWIQLRCGTDAALLLAMMEHITKTDLYDHEFVENYAVGFDKLQEHLRAYTPEWAEPITGITAERIRAFAEDYACNGPCAIADGNGTDMYLNVSDTSRCIAMLQGMCGYIDIPGGAMILPHIRQRHIGLPMTNESFGKDVFPLFTEVPFSYLKEAILKNVPGCPHGMIVHHGNPALVQANSVRTRQALEKLDFLMVNDIFMTSTAELADVVLPMTSPFERWSYRVSSSYDRPFAVCGRPLAEPPGDAWDSSVAEYNLAKRLSIDDKYPFHDQESLTNYLLEPEHITLEMLKNEQYCFKNETPIPQKYKQNGFFPDGGLFRFYSENYKNAGLSPMPIYRKVVGRSSEINNEFPLLCTSRRPRQFVHTKLHNMYTLTRTHPLPYIWISKEDAETRGIIDGTLVLLQCGKGEQKFAAHIADNQPIGLVAAEFGWGNPTDGGANFNMLTDDAEWDPASGATSNRLFACEVSVIKNDIINV